MGTCALHLSVQRRGLCAQRHSACPEPYAAGCARHVAPWHALFDAANLYGCTTSSDFAWERKRGCEVQIVVINASATPPALLANGTKRMSLGHPLLVCVSEQLQTLGMSVCL